METVFLLIGISVLIISTVWLLYNNKFLVEPNKRERLVLQNVLTGSMEVLEPGIHFRPIWWKRLEKVDLNREDVPIDGDEFRTADGALATINYRFDIIAGRNFNPVTGQLQDPDNPDELHPDPDNQNLVTEEAVKLAVTRIDFPEKKKRVQEIMRGAVEEELGLYNLKDLVSPSTLPGGVGVRIAALVIEGTEIYPPETAHTISHLYQALAKRIMARGNKRLTFVGINVTNAQITNLKPSGATQESIEKPLRAGYEADAAEITLDRARAKGKKLTYREALVAEDPAAFATTAQAEATRDAAKGISEAIRNGTRDIGDGLKKFGKG